MEVWTDEKGGKVQIKNFFPRIYTDDISEELSSRYDIYTAPLPIGKLGKTEYECAANSLARICYATQQVAGLELKDLNLIGDEFRGSLTFGKSWDYSALKGTKLLREKWIKGIEVLFPTEELIKQAFTQRKSLF